MNTLTYFSTSLLLILTSCSSSISFTPAQKAQLTTLEIKAPSISESSYIEPQGHEDIKLGVVGYAGFTVATVSRAIRKKIEFTQQAQFDEKYNDAASKVHTSIPTMLSEDLQNKTIKVISSIPDLKGKIRSTSNNQLITNITSYGFKRVSKSDGKVLMTPHIKGTFSLIADGVEILPPTKIKAQTYPNKEGKYEITDYLNNKSLTMEDFQTTCDKLAKAIKEKLENKYDQPY